MTPTDNACFRRSPTPDAPPNGDRAERVIAFIERFCLVTIGATAGQPLRLRPWQKAFIRDVYGPARPDGRRLVRRAVFSQPRKGGKSELTAALILAHLVGPEAETNGEIYSAANDREQAAIVFNAVRRMVEASPTLSGLITIVPSTKTAFVKGSGLKSAGSRFRALSADAGTKHGLNPSFVAYDELAQARSRELLDTLLTSQGARSKPLFMVISTQSADPTHPLSEMIDDALTGADPTIACHLYSAPDGADLLDEGIWFGCNPALGDFRDLDEFRAMANRAARLPSEEQAFRLLYFNQRVSDQASVIPASEWKACSDPGTKIADGEEVILALDLSGRFDLTALTAITTGDLIRTTSWAWKPAELVADHARRDGADYVTWAGRGHLLTTPGRSIDPQSIALKIAELVGRYEVRALVYDRWKIDELLREFDRIGLAAQVGPGDGLRLEPWGQGFRDMDPAVNALESAIIDRRLTHDGNPVVNFCVTNAVATQDPAGLRKLAKDKSRFRIDAAVTLAMALGFLARDRAARGDVPTPFEDPDFEYFFG